MGANDTTTLHDKDDPRLQGLMSLMDIMGSSIVCDFCGRWQRLGTFSATEARQHAERHGWRVIDGKDQCRKCAASPSPPPQPPSTRAQEAER